MLYHQPSQAGPGLWVRVQHRFGPRMPEWMLAAITALWGGVLVNSPNLFDSPTWSGFRSIFHDEWTLGWIMVFLGVLRIGGLIVNGARKNVTPWIRSVSASLGCCLFVGITYCYWQSGIISTWLAVYPVFAVVELLNIYRAAHDAGESHAPH
jgi:hypothetical protein